MKPENTVQWAVVALALGAGLFVWFKPKHAPRWEIEPPPVLPHVAQEDVTAVSSNQVTAAVAPVQILSQTAARSPNAKLIAQKAWMEASDMLAQIDGVKLTRSSHPQIVVTAAILDLHNEHHQFKGYNIQTASVESHCSIRVQVLDAASGTIEFSKTLEGEKSDTQNTVVKESEPQEEREFGAVAAAIHKLDNDAQFKAAVSRSKAKPKPATNTTNSTP
jgi:hypothetical protein